MLLRLLLMGAAFPLVVSCSTIPASEPVVTVTETVEASSSPSETTPLESPSPPDSSDESAIPDTASNVISKVEAESLLIASTTVEELAGLPVKELFLGLKEGPRSPKYPDLVRPAECESAVVGPWTSSVLDEVGVLQWEASIGWEAKQDGLAPPQIYFGIHIYESESEALVAYQNLAEASASCTEYSFQRADLVGGSLITEQWFEIDLIPAQDRLLFDGVTYDLRTQRLVGLSGATIYSWELVLYEGPGDPREVLLNLADETDQAISKLS